MITNVNCQKRDPAVLASPRESNHQKGGGGVFQGGTTQD